MIIGITFTSFLLLAKEDDDSTKVQTGTLAINYIDGQEIDTYALLPISEPNLNTKTKKRVSIGYIFLILFIIVVALFFFINPEILKGKNKEYTCTKSYTHEKLPANINEKVELVFTSKKMLFLLLILLQIMYLMILIIIKNLEIIVIFINI